MGERVATENMASVTGAADPNALGAFIATALTLWGESTLFHQLLLGSPAAVREAAAATNRAPVTLRRALADDPEEAVRKHIARLTDDVELLDALADDPSMDVQIEVALNIYTAQSTRRRQLSQGSDPVKVRVITSPLTESSAIEGFLDEVGDGVADDGLPWAMKVARFCPNLTASLVQRFLDHPDERVRQGLANNEADYPGKAEAVDRLSRDPSPSVRTELVMTYDTPAETVNRMCDEESDPSLRLWFVSNAYGVLDGTIDKMMTDPSMQDSLRELEQRRGALPERLATRRSDAKGGG